MEALHHKFEKLVSDRKSGSTELFMKACDFAIECIRAGATDLAIKVCDELGKTMVIFRKIRRFVREGNIGEIKRLKTTAMEAESAAYIRFKDLATKMGWKSAVTISKSALVQSSLQAVEKVYVLESRPMLEGRECARWLAEKGITVVFGVDALMAQFVFAADVVTVGCDAWTHHKFVNKTGTLPLLLTARGLGKPTALITSELKFVTELPKIEEKSKSEVWENEVKGVIVRNTYFEAVPMSLVDYMIIC